MSFGKLNSSAAHLLALSWLFAGCGGWNPAEHKASGPDASAPSSIPSSFQWVSSAPLVAPITDATHPILSVKDPSVVFFQGRWHVFATTANDAGAWSIVHVSFAEWDEAIHAAPQYLDDYPALRGYHAAPQVFFFRPQNKWYLIFQSGQPQYTTTDDLDRPETWTPPVNFFATEPAIVKENKGTSGGWLDFWIICEAPLCHLFFTDDNGTFYRSQTDSAQFPQGFGEPVVAMKGTKESLFEGSSTYRLKGMNRYLTLVEAFGPSGIRYYRSFVADTLDGAWTPLADTFQNPFASQNNVTFAGAAWTRDFSHGELLRDGYDETLIVDPGNLRFLYQGVDPAQTAVEYFRLPYRLALLTPASR